MKSRGFIFLLIICFNFCAIPSRANRKHLGFGFDNQKESVTIPFKSYDNLIIIESVIDDKKKLNLILDTGIRSLVLFHKSYLPKISTHTFNINFTGAGTTTPLLARVSANHNLRLCEDVVANQINAVILKRSNYNLHKLNGIKIHGAFGYQLFSRFQVKIDYKNQLITLTEPKKTKTIEGFESIPIVIHDTKPFIKTHILNGEKKWERLSLIIDLGANHKLLLLDESRIGHSMKSNFGHRRIAEGLSGSIYGKKIFLDAVRLGPISYEHTEILLPSKKTYHRESSGIEKHGSIGGKLFDKSTIILDYMNCKLFVKKKNTTIDASKDVSNVSSISF